MKQQQYDHENIKRQLEDDADREIYELKAKYEAQLKDEQQLNLDLRAETGIYSKKLNSSQKEIRELKHTITIRDADLVKLKSIISQFEKDIAELQKEIAERDDTIQEKEKRIFELKKKTQELEKYKYVLEFKITELKSQIEPRERKIFDQKEEMKEMVSELENQQKTIATIGINGFLFIYS